LQIYDILPISARKQANFNYYTPYATQATVQRFWKRKQLFRGKNLPVPKKGVTLQLNS
jgi:hypothetical protein